MSQLRSAQGQCLCGSIKIKTQKMSNNLGACHCSMCRRWAAGPFLAVDCGTEVEIEGREQLGNFDSSEWAERGFCKSCGTCLFYRLKQTGQHIVNSEIFNTGEFNFDHQVFIDDKPSYYEFSNQTHNMTGAEVFAKFTEEKH